MGSIKESAYRIQQPNDGYIPPSGFTEKKGIEGFTLTETGNVPDAVLEATVSALARLATGFVTNAAFASALSGADKVGQREQANELIGIIEKNYCMISEKEVIDAACKLSAFSVFNNSERYMHFDMSSCNPDSETEALILAMVRRTNAFLHKYGPVINTAATLPGSYTEKISEGECSFIVEDSIWEIRTGNIDITKVDTFELLLNYIMGCNSEFMADFSKVRYLGIYNVRTDKIYFYPVENLQEKMIEDICKNIIGYRHISRLDTAPAYKKKAQKVIETAQNSDPSPAPADLSMKDITKRYHCSSSDVKKQYIKNGLPYQLVDGVYTFRSDKVTKWELEKKFITDKEGKKTKLPAFKKKENDLQEELKKARKEKDKNRIEEIKLEMDINDIVPEMPIEYKLIIAGGIVLGVLILLLIVKLRR